MDKLLACAKEFSKLLDIEYSIVIGRKGKTIPIKVRFNKLNFHHLAGLHKLKDLTIATENRSKVFSDILKNKLTYDDICKSKYFAENVGRIDVLPSLEQLFDTNELVFKYNEKLNVFSLIQADFILSTPLNQKDVYLFLSNDNAETYFCRSLFPKTNIDYTVGQTKYTLLYKEKINLTTNESIVQYDRLKRQN